MTGRETPVVFDCRGEQLIGIVSQPDFNSGPGVLMLVGGRQYRVGSHRQHVVLGRQLMDAGISSFRFDFRGMGDSTGDQRSFLDLDEDIASAIAAFKAACPHLTRIVLWGLCDAATAAVLYWTRIRDPIISGMILANPWLRSDGSHARARIKHYYSGRILSVEFWHKLLTGGIRPLLALREYSNHRRAAANSDVAGYEQTFIEGLTLFPGPTLLILSGNDLTAKEFIDSLDNLPGGKYLLQRSDLERCDVPGSDHTFSRAGWRLQMDDAVLDWVRRHSESLRKSELHMKT